MEEAAVAEAIQRSKADAKEEADDLTVELQEELARTVRELREHIEGR
jgi:hypothetical protein